MKREVDVAVAIIYQPSFRRPVRADFIVIKMQKPFI